ncbi:QcrA and Rieske domain-containing protein [Bythopirellula polymerisocia]|nr:Rieske (2Fe-2S) protein [Bythopirellula polymerisocia]
MEEHHHDLTDDVGERRGFLGAMATAMMAGGLIGGYGTFATYAGRFLYPSGGDKTSWQFLATVDQLKIGSSIPFETPVGSKVVVARQSEGSTAEDFIALSSVCPHLGCAVHWESQNNRFFCPCHNGAFDASGKATEGPPAAANQSLKRFPLMVENGLLFIKVPTESVRGTREA